MGLHVKVEPMVDFACHGGWFVLGEIRIFYHLIKVKAGQKLEGQASYLQRIWRYNKNFHYKNRTARPK